MPRLGLHRARGHLEAVAAPCPPVGPSEREHKAGLIEQCEPADTRCDLQLRDATRCRDRGADARGRLAADTVGGRGERGIAGRRCGLRLAGRLLDGLPQSHGLGFGLLLDGLL